MMCVVPFCFYLLLKSVVVALAASRSGALWSCQPFPYFLLLLGAIGWIVSNLLLDLIVTCWIEGLFPIVHLIDVSLLLFVCALFRCKIILVLIFLFLRFIVPVLDEFGLEPVFTGSMATFHSANRWYKLSKERPVLLIELIEGCPMYGFTLNRNMFTFLPFGSRAEGIVKSMCISLLVVDLFSFSGTLQGEQRGCLRSIPNVHLRLGQLLETLRHLFAAYLGTVGRMESRRTSNCLLALNFFCLFLF